LAAGIGLLDGIVAFALYKLIGFFTNAFFFHRISADFTSARFHHLGAWVIVIPVMGGIIVAFMAKYGTPRIKGHGIPEATEAVLINRSRIEPRVAILKPISAAVAIGTGGPFGAEGPIIQTGGALGSLVGQLFHTTASERKVLLACGAAAGMSATFNTPIARHPCYRTAVIRVQIPVFHSSGHCQHARNRSPHAVAGHRSNV
jgi:chloride channel protein, CIC family